MSSVHRLTTILGSLSPVLLIAWSSAQEAPTVDDLRGLHDRSSRMIRRLTLKESITGSELTGWKISDTRPMGDVSGSVSRTLLISPEGRPITITEVHEPRSGRLVTRLSDEISGWWIEYWSNSGYQADDLDHALAIAQSRKAWWNRPEGSSEPRLQTLAVYTRNGSTVSATIDVASHDYGLAAFLTEARKSPEWGIVAREVPDPVLESLLFLEEVVEDNSLSSEIVLEKPESTPGRLVASAWSPLITVVTASLRDASVLNARSSRERWSLTAGTPTVETAGLEGEFLELTTKFRSLEPADPLPEKEVRELLLAVREAPKPGATSEDSNTRS